MEAPSLADHRGRLRVAKTLVTHKAETSMRFYTKQHPDDCGLDRHTRTMSVCSLNQAGETLLHRHMQATREALLKAIAPYRDQIVMEAEWMVTWDWLADLCADQGIPVVLGHAPYMKAIHGGKANNDTLDAHTIAVLLRGGMLPQADVDPADMRASRDRRRRRTHLARTRGELLAHGQQTHSPDNLPALGKKIAYKANRDGVAERVTDPAGQKSLAVDLALIGTTMRCSVTSNSPSSEPPSTMTPIPWIGCAQSPALARFSASCGSTQSMPSSASLGCKISLRLVVS